VQIKMEKVKDNIYVETEYLGCNPSFVVTASGIVMIDAPGLRPLEALAWKKEIARFGEVSYIINTDHHWDHTLGNYFFDGDFILHEGTAKRFLAEDRADACKKYIRVFDPASEHFLEHYFVKRPRFTYSDRMGFYFGGEVFELVHIHGHTEDETLVYMPLKKVVFSGDNVCTIGIPNLSESYPTEWLKALDDLETLEIDVLIPGHGKVGNKDSIRQFRAQFVGLMDQVKGKMDQGWSREQIVREVSYEDNIHRDYPPSTAERFHQVMKLGIGRLYDVLTSSMLKAER